MSVYDSNGRPVDARAHVASGVHVIDGLPAWLDGATYRADDDVITLRVAVPQSQHALSHVLALEMTADAARALLEAIGRCVTQSERTMAVLDVPFDSFRS